MNTGVDISKDSWRLPGAINLSRGRKVLLWFAVWTLLGLLQTGRMYFWYYVLIDTPIWMPVIIIWAVGDMYLWGLLSPVVYWIARRVPFERGNTWRFVLIHAPAAVMLFCVQVLLYTVLWWLTKDICPSELSASIQSFDGLYVAMLRTKHFSAIMTYLLIGFVSYTLIFYRRYREQEMQKVAIRNQLVQAELAALKGHLQPHFLFNTLNTIAALVDLEPSRAGHMIARLSELLRGALDTLEVIKFTLREEMELLQRYLDIQRVRFEDRLTLKIEIDRDAWEALVPCLILQPIVENAMDHGIAKMTEGGVVKIAARVENGRLRIIVSDNGPGLGTALAEPETNGLGLSNTRKRLEATYGKAHGFQVRSGDSGGVVAAIAMPLEYGELNEESE